MIVFLHSCKILRKILRKNDLAGADTRRRSVARRGSVLRYVTKPHHASQRSRCPAKSFFLQFGKQLAKPKQIRREIPFRHDDGHGCDDKQHPQYKTGCERLVEDQDPEDHSSQRFERAEDGCRSRPYVMNGLCRGQERDHGRQNSQAKQ